MKIRVSSRVIVRRGQNCRTLSTLTISWKRGIRSCGVRDIP